MRTLRHAADFVAPFGGQEKMVEEVQLKSLDCKPMNILQAKPENWKVATK
jgi:hypothetical protein